MVHGDLGAEAAITQVGPVAHLTVADAGEVGQAIAGQIGEEDRLGTVGKDEFGSLFLVEGLEHPLRRAETGFGERGVPAEGIVFSDQQVGVAVAGEVDELEIGIVPIQDGQRGERREGLPVLVHGALIEAGCGTLELDHVELTVASEIKKLWPPPTQGGERGLPSDYPDRTEARRWRFLAILDPEVDGTQVTLVKPTPGLLGQDARETFAIQIHPLVARTVETVRQIFEALGVDLPDRFVDGRLAVFEFQRRE